jgi:hypothetical protein
MNCLLAFICRCVLFAVYTVVSKTENELVALTMFQRAVLTCVQICILGVAWVLYEICAFVIKAVSLRYPYGSALDDQDLAEDQDEDRSLVDTSDGDPIDKPEKPATSTGAHSIVFASQIELQQYVCKVHLIGVVVWSTMLSMDYTLSQASFTFLLGMLIGNVASTLRRVDEPAARLPMATYSLYWLAVGALVVLYMVQDGASAVEYTEAQVGIHPSRVAWSDVFTLLNVMLAPLSSGVSWTYWMDGGTLLKHHRTSLYTSVLLSLPVVIAVQRQFLTDMFSRYSPPLLAHVLLTEPLLKFMVIYVLTLSLKTESVLEMLVVNAAVTGICYVSFTPHGDLFNALVALLVCLLVLMHVVRLARRAWYKRNPPANFTIA